MIPDDIKQLLSALLGGPVIFGDTTAEMHRQLEQIHKPLQCSCQICQDMCKRAPCIGTPQDIMKLAQAGHLDELRPTDYGGLSEWGVPWIPMVQIRAMQESEWYENGGGQCPLWDPVTGLCRVHAIKPVEGRFAGHSSQSVFTSASWVAAISWLLPTNRALVKHLFRLVGAPIDEKESASTVICLPGETRLP
jgi:hypothetical protein